MLIETLTPIHAPIERCFDLARSVEAHVAGNVHGGEFATAIAGVTTGLLEFHQQVTWSAKHFGMRFKLTSEITKFDRPSHFQDAMIRGPFRLMIHDHYFRPLAPDLTEMRDVFRFAAPLPVLGLIAERVVLRGYMRTLLAERNAVIREIAESDDWRRYVREAL